MLNLKKQFCVQNLQIKKAYQKKGLEKLFNLLKYKLFTRFVKIKNSREIFLIYLYKNFRILLRQLISTVK